MKALANIGLSLGLVLIIIAACGTKVKYDDEMLVVQRDQIEFSLNDSNVVQVVMDIPESGPEFMTDSVTMFLNHQLYDFLSEYYCLEYSFEELRKKYETGLYGGLLDVYYSSYSGEDYVEDIPDFLKLTCLMIAQTESFVTYGVELLRGAYDNSKFRTYSFDKKDGRMMDLDSVISGKDLVRFFDNNPDLNLPFEDWQIERIKDGDYLFLPFDVGLLEDGVLLVNEDGFDSHYYVTMIDYDALFSYLSKEARGLVKAKGDNEKYSYREWCVGEEIGSVTTDSGEWVHLMQLFPLWCSFSRFSVMNVESILSLDSVVTLTPYVRNPRSGCYVRTDILPVSVMEFAIPLGAWSRPSPMDDDDYFILDENGVLFVPYEKEAFTVEFAPYKFNGEKFVSISYDDYAVPAGEEIAILKDEGFLGVKGDDIHLLDNGDIRAYIVRDGYYIPKKVFPDREGVSNRLSISTGDLLTSNPDGAFNYHFIPGEGLLYVPFVERFGMAVFNCLDRYMVYQFNGHQFVARGVEGGFWLHPSVREYGGLELLGRTDDYLVRVDAMRVYHLQYEDEYEAEEQDPCRYRYSAWKHKSSMLEAPDLVIENGRLDKGEYVFENKGYKYVVGSDLMVYEGDRLILKQELEILADVNDLP